MVAYGLHAMQQSHVARPHSPCRMLWLMEPLIIVSDSDRSTRVTSADFCKQNIHLSEASLILRLLHSLLDCHTKRYATTSSCTALKSRLISMWPLTSPLSAVFVHGSQVLLQIQQAHPIRHSETNMSSAIFWRIRHGNSPWSSPLTVHSPGFTMTLSWLYRETHSLFQMLCCSQHK